MIEFWIVQIDSNDPFLTQFNSVTIPGIIVGVCQFWGDCSNSVNVLFKFVAIGLFSFICVSNGVFQLIVILGWYCSNSNNLLVEE